MTFKRFFVSGTPKSKGSYSIGARGQIYPAVKGLKKWEDTIAWMARAEADTTPSAGKIDLNLDFIMRGLNPGVMIEVREVGILEAEAEYYTQKPDLDKLCRAVMDGLKKGGIYKDDAQVCRIEAQKLK